MRVYLTNSQKHIVAVFTELTVNGRAKRYLSYFFVEGNTFKKLSEKRISKKDGNSAYHKLLADGFVVRKKEAVA